MSNAMRSGKRVLAGVAAGALALGALTIASAPAASAKPSIKPKAGTVSATVYAVRPTALGTASAVNLPSATMTWPAGYGTLANNAATKVDLLTAPTATAKMYFGADDTVTLNADDSFSGFSSGAISTLDDSIFEFRVDTAGSYTGQIFNGTDTVNFTFTTAGAPTSMVLAPASQTVLVGGQADLEITLKDANGRNTQPQSVDTISLTRAPTDDTIVVLDDTPASYNPLSGLTATQLSLGSYPFSLNTNPYNAGTTTITATPLGTLPGSGVLPQTATVTKSGSVSSTAVANIAITAPATAFNSWNTTTGTTSWTTPARIAQVPEGTTSMTITVDDTSAATAGNKIRIAVTPSVGTVNGSAATSYFDLVTDANKRATQVVTLGGLAVTNGTSIVINQVTVADQQVNFAGNQPVRLTTRVLAPAVNAQSTTITPAGGVAKIGDVIPVTVTVDDSFGTVQPNYNVQVYRGTAVSGGTFLGQATTNAQGVANLTVTNASTVTVQTQESYTYVITAPGGVPGVSNSFTIASGTVITYTTTGNITSMSLVVSGTLTSQPTNAAPTVSTAPLINIPDVTTAVPTGVSAGAFTVSTGAQTTAADGKLATFQANTLPANAVTITVPTGVYVSKTAPLAWNAGTQTITVASGTPVYVWGTKVGVHDVVATSGGLTLTGKVKIQNTPGDAYNIALTPDKADVQKGSFADLTVKVTDYWGNPVLTADNAVRVNASGAVLLGGLNNTTTVTTDAAGEAKVVVIAQGDPGAGTVTARPNTAVATPAWATTYSKPATFTTAPATSAASLITVTSTSSKSISITGSRTTVSGKPGIKIDGVVTGIDNGKTVVPYFRFPGETTFAEGTARPVISDGSFTWQRKTGKKFYAYVTSDDGVVKSNRVIIPAN